MANTTQRIKPRSIALAFFNANGIKNQRDAVSVCLIDNQIDVMLVQESLLKPSIRDPRIAGFNMVRNDRLTARGGGTAIYYKRSLHCVPLDTPTLTNIEASVCRIAMTGHAPITLVSAYLSPNKELLKSDLQALFSLDSSVIVAGDLNCKHTSWCCRICNKNGTRLHSLTDQLSFDVIAPLSPTHYPHNPRHRAEILDIALIKNVTLRLHSMEVLHELDSDHRPVLLHLGDSSSEKPQLKSIIDWTKLEETLKTSSDALTDKLPPVCTKDETDEAIRSFTDSLNAATVAASRQVSAANDRRWKLPEDIRELMREKNAANRHYDAFPSEENRARLRALQREVKRQIAELRDQQWDNLLGEIKPSHQAYWRLARSLKADTVVHMPPLIKPDGSLAFDDNDKAECLAASVQAQCSPNTEEVDSDHLTTVYRETRLLSSRPPIDQLDAVTPDEVRTIITGLKDRKAPGADGISNRVLKHLPASLITVLVLIFNAALDNCHFPSAWKRAIVIGIHKPGKDSSIPSSYRPISLLSSLGKIYERLLLTRLRSFATSHGIIPDEQFGFRPRHSCIQQVHRLTEHILENFYLSPKSHQTGAVFFDVAKAFDKVWHDGLVYKLHSLKIPDRLVLIVQDFLSNRTFQFRVEGTLSSPHAITAGVPQRSALSPILYSLYTSDIPRFPNVEMALFADDTALYSSHSNANYIRIRLQKAINLLGDWFRKWRIQVNPEKSAVIRFCRGGQRGPERHKLRMLDQEIPWVRKHKYLGVTFDYRMTFKHHIKIVRDRAAFFLGRLHPLIGAKSKMGLRNKITLYKTCIRPVMTYASVAFAHAADEHIDRLQAIQNRFLRRAVGAPWYVRNIDLHCDMELPSIRSYMKEASERFFNNAPHHPNRLVVSASNYTPEPDPGCNIKHDKRRLRPRNVLTNPNYDAKLKINLDATAPQRGHKRGPKHTIRLRGNRPCRRGHRPNGCTDRRTQVENPAEIVAG